MHKRAEMPLDEEVAPESVESADSFETKPIQNKKPPVVLASKKKPKAMKKKTKPIKKVT